MTDWANDEPLKARLRQLWAEGHSTAEIGRMMGHSWAPLTGWICQAAPPRSSNGVTGSRHHHQHVALQQSRWRRWQASLPLW